MISFQNLPTNAKVTWFMQPTSGNEVHTWTKPTGCNFIYIVAVGGGGAGGAGFSAAAGNQRTGGGGGGSAAMSSILVPAVLITDSIFIRVGRGGTSSTVPTSTIVSAYRVAAVGEYYLVGYPGNNGSGGTSIIPGTAGAGGICPLTDPTLTFGLGQVGKFSGFDGDGGVIGAMPGMSAVNKNCDFILSGGGGGAGITNNNAGGLSGSNLLSNFQQTNYSTAVSGGLLGSAGGNGFWIPKTFKFYGGGGGGSNNSIAGGNGGKGAPGCGGGGGGGGTTGGTGGNGGDGFVLIISY